MIKPVAQLMHTVQSSALVAVVILCPVASAPCLLASRLHRHRRPLNLARMHASPHPQHHRALLLRTSQSVTHLSSHRASCAPSKYYPES